MGNLNQFYLLGRLVSAPVTLADPKGEAVVLLVQPGTGARAPRGAPPLRLLAGGPQLEPAKALVEGEAVLLRGQLRQEPSESEAGELVAWVQAIEPVLGEGGSGGGGGGASGASTRPRRKRRRRPRKEGESRGEPRPRREGGSSEGGSSEGGSSAGDAPAPAPPRDPAAGLPPHRPVAEAPAAPPAPDPSYQKDMPF